MAATLEVIVYGGGGVFTEYFNAIAAAIGDDVFKTIFRIALLLAGITALFSAITKRNFLSCVKWLAVYYFVFYILFLPKVSLEITDRIERHSYPVGNVPLGLGVLASFSTIIGDSLTRLTDEFFSMPDDLRYSNTGMMMASKLVTAASQFSITDPKFNENLQSFINQCVFYDLLLKKYELAELFDAKDIWEFVTQKASPARAFLYNGQVITCDKGAANLSVDWNKPKVGAIDQAAKHYGGRLFSTKNAEDAKAQLVKYLPLSYEYLTALSEDAGKIMQQNLMANAIQDGVVRLGAIVDAPAALQSYAFTRAQEQQRLTHQTLGESAAYWLPIMKNTFEAIMYGCFIFIILLAVFPFGLTVLKNYIYTIVWIQAWAPLYAVIHLICSYYAKTHSLAAAGEQGLTLQSLSGLLQVNQDMAGLAGYLSLSVPFLAAGLVRGMAGTMTQLAQYIGGVTQSAGISAASEAVSGNFSMANTSFNTHSAFNTTANHLDTAGRMTSGINYQMPGGEAMTITPDGTAVMDRRGVISSLGADVHLADSIRNSALQQADASYNAGLSYSKSSGDAQSAGMRGLYELTNHASSSRSSSDAWVHSTSASTQEAFRDVKELTQKFANEHHISYGEAANVLGRIYVEGRGGASGSLGFKGGSITGEASIHAGGVRESQHVQSDELKRQYSDAQDFIHNTNYVHDVETITRATRDQSLHATNDEGNRLIQSVGASFEQADTLRKEAANSFQAAESYRHVATQAQENAVSIDVNASQGLYEYISSQPGTNGRGHMGASGAATVMKDPELAQHYANQYASQYVHSQLSNWNEGMAHSKQGIQKIYQSNNQQISSATVQERNQANQLQVATMSTQAELGGKNFIDSSVKQKVNNEISHDNGIAQNANSYLTTVGDAQETKVVMEENRNRHGNLIKDVATGLDIDDH